VFIVYNKTREFSREGKTCLHHLRVTLSKEETPITAAAIAPRTTPPATTDSKVFFKEGVIAASAAKGLERVAINVALAAVDIFNCHVAICLQILQSENTTSLNRWRSIVGNYLTRAEWNLRRVGLYSACLHRRYGARADTSGT